MHVNQRSVGFANENRRASSEHMPPQKIMKFILGLIAAFMIYFMKLEVILAYQYMLSEKQNEMVR